MSRLLYRVRPRAGESLMGYLVHLANRNGYSFAQLANLAGIPARRFINPTDALYQRVNLAPIAKLIEAPESVLADLTCSTNRRYGRLDQVKYAGFELPFVFLRAHRCVVCPACLAEDGFVAAELDLVFTTRCQRHNQLLLDSCPACGDRLNWIRHWLTKCDCGMDLYKVSTQAAQALPTPASLVEVERLAVLVAFQLSLSSPTPPLNYLRDVSLPLLDKMVARAHGALQRGDLGVYGLLHKVAKARARRGGALGSRWPGLPLQHLVHISDATVDWVRQAAAACQIPIAQRWRGRLPVHEVSGADAGILLDKSVFKVNKLCGHGLTVTKPHSGQRPTMIDAGTVAMVLRNGCQLSKRRSIRILPGMITVDEAARELDVTTEAVRRIAKLGFIPYFISAGRAMNIAPQAVADFHAEYVFMRELSRHWGMVSMNLCEKLKALGCKPVSGPAIDGGLLYLFRRCELAVIGRDDIARVRNYPTRTGRPKAHSRAGSLEGFLSLYEVAGLLGLSSQTVMRLIKYGFLRDGRPSNSTVHSLVIEADAVRAYIAAYRENPALVRFEVVANQLGIPLKMMDHICNRRSDVTVVSDGYYHYFHKREVEYLIQRRKQTFTSAEAAKFLGAKPHYLVNQVKRGRLRPVSGPGIDGAKRYLFLRKDIRALRKSS